MPALILIEGPAGGGKSQLARDMLAAGEIDLLADTTALWAAVGGYERDPATGQYPVRADDDPALGAAQYLQATVAGYALREGLTVGVTTSQRDQVERWRQVAERNGFQINVVVRTVDPGQGVVTERLSDPVTGELSPECQAAIGRWYR